MNDNRRAYPSAKEWFDWLRPTVPSWLFRPATFAVLYAVIGLGTFGHVAADNWRADQYEYEQCDHNRKVNESNSYNSCHQPETEMIALKGFGAGVLWPLYLSWKVQQ